MRFENKLPRLLKLLRYKNMAPSCVPYQYPILVWKISHWLLVPLVMIPLDSLDNYELRSKVTKKNELNVYMIFLHQGIGLQDEVSLKKLHWPSVKPQVTFGQVHCSYLVTKNDHFSEETIAQWQFIQEPTFQFPYVE
jgi:hypothetical protein